MSYNPPSHPEGKPHPKYAEWETLNKMPGDDMCGSPWKEPANGIGKRGAHVSFALDPLVEGMPNYTPWGVGRQGKTCEELFEQLKWEVEQAIRNAWTTAQVRPRRRSLAVSREKTFGWFIGHGARDCKPKIWPRMKRMPVGLFYCDKFKTDEELAAAAAAATQ